LEKTLTITDLPTYEDNRGFLSSFWTPKVGTFVEDRYSVSKQNVLRGLHGDAMTDKLIVVLHGEVEFFATPYYKNHKDFGKHTFLKLSGAEPRSVYLPRGYINGHLCISSECVFFYKWSHYYKGAENQVSVGYDDEDLSILWSVTNPILSDRDRLCTTKFRDTIYDD
jgi:dTDP-4-dehydrorhamnose 3,5-epimerase